MLPDCCLNDDVGLLVCRMPMNFGPIDLLAGVVMVLGIVDLKIDSRC